MSDATSAARVLAILQMFEREKRPLSLKELSEYCQIPASTCHSLVHTLMKCSYLYQTGRRKDLYPTRRIFDIGAIIVANDPFLQRMEPVMEALRDRTQETIILGKRQKDNIVYLVVLEGPQTIRYSAAVGDMKPLHSTCIGKTMLAAMKPNDLRVWLEQQSLEEVTGNTIVSYARLIEHLQEAEEVGYFTTRGENVQDVTAISVPISINDELLGLAVAGPSIRMDERFDEMVSLLKQSQSELIAGGIAL